MAHDNGDLDDLAGRKLGEDGRYVLDRFLDRGGYGEVYLGTDTKFKLPVAVKIGLSSRDSMKEARLAAQVRHNHIVQVIDYGSDNGLAYLVMEYLQGDDLEKLFKKQENRLTPDQLLKFVDEVGDALAYAHANDLIHRDLKPRNVILNEQVTSTGVAIGRSKFVLVDFGIAAKLNAEGTLGNPTRNGAGTIEYMAPELLAEDPKKATRQSDIYAFGVILYQMMTGRVPFPQTDPSHVALASCLNAIVSASPPRFLDVAADRHYPDAIEDLVLRCLEKDAARRPQAIAEVRQQFMQSFRRESPRLTNPSQETAPPPHPQQSWRWPSIAASFILILAVTWGVKQQFPPPRATISALRKPNLPSEFNFEAADAAKVIGVDGKYYYDRIHRVIGSRPVEFLLVPRPDEGGDPASFYIMKDKVSRELFHQFLETHPEPLSRDRKLEITKSWKKTGTMRWPITGTTVDEADQFAHWMGGQLPTRQQWDRASGYHFFGPRPKCKPPADWQPNVWRRGPFRDPWTNGSDGIALKQHADVGTSSNDESYFGCRDMAGNGYEFLRDLTGNGQLPLPPSVAKAGNFIWQRGQCVGSPLPLMFEEIDGGAIAHDFDTPDDLASFRVVIEKLP